MSELSDQGYKQRFKQLVVQYALKAAECESIGHKETNTVESVLHDKNEGATWVEIFICDGCDDATAFHVCNKYHETLQTWLKESAETSFGTCGICGYDWTYGEVYKDSFAWG